MTTEFASQTGSTTPRADGLRGLLGGAVHLPGDPGYDAARTPWNVAVDQRPAAVACPASPDEVSEIVRAAAACGLRVAPQGTGHNASALGPLDDCVLLRTSAMTSVHIDPAARTARVGAGVLWLDVVEAAAAHGLAALHGSSPDVGVVGYTLGGGIGWYARQLGMAADSIVSADLVLADGRQIRADETTNPEVFWAIRGGGGNFGIITAMEFRLFPIETAYAGMLVWDQVHAEPVLRAWATWAVDAPDCVTTSLRLLNLPPLPELPPAVRGRQLVAIDGAVLADDERAVEILAELRALQPEIDTFARMPAASLVRLHMDPEGPTPGVSAAVLLAELPDAAIESFLAAAGPGSGSTLLAAELRQLGGALARPAEHAGALSQIDGKFVLFGVAIAATPEMGAAGHADAVALAQALSPYSSGRDYLNFVETPVDMQRSFPADTWQKLVDVRSAVDPSGLVVANHRVR
jgi:FAD/FMN-containing dehydrogenase